MLAPYHWQVLTRVVSGVTLFAFAFLFAGCGVTGAPIDVAIPALASEDLQGPCRFELSMAHPEEVQQGVLVMYERYDTYQLYDDAELRRTLAAMNYSLLWATQCKAKSTGDIQANAGKGPARMLLAALNQVAAKSGHAELATNGIILYGFSAAGVLTATMANTQPDRLIGTIQYAAGSAEVDLDGVEVTAPAARIPTLILANALDVPAGTTRSLRYFQRGRGQNAPWAYAVQNDTTHCCNVSTRNIILPWMQEIAALNAGTNATAQTPQDGNSGTLASFLCTPNGIVDSQYFINCHFTAATLSGPTSSLEQAGWLPNQKSGQAWLAWVKNPQTN